MKGIEFYVSVVFTAKIIIISIDNSTYILLMVSENEGRRPKKRAVFNDLDDDEWSVMTTSMAQWEVAGSIPTTRVCLFFVNK